MTEALKAAKKSNSKERGAALKLAKLYKSNLTRKRKEEMSPALLEKVHKNEKSDYVVLADDNEYNSSDSAPETLKATGQS